MKKKICVITGSRAEYGRQYWLLRQLLNDKGVNLKVVVTGSHTLQSHGLTIQEIKKDGFPIAAVIPMKTHTDEARDIGESIGYLTIDFVKLFARFLPDLVLLYGDRFELLAVASACISMRIPIGHIGGGQITEGAIDEQVRHMLTKASHLHFVANKDCARRLLQMGEERWRICVSGSPALDSLMRTEKMPREKLEKELGIRQKAKLALVTFHPTTLDLHNNARSLHQLARALCAAQRAFNLYYIITYPNLDIGSSEVIRVLRQFEKEHPSHVTLKKNLGQVRYVSLLSIVDLVIGNSSSGIVEAPSFGVPVVNIGDRQRGRACAKNVIHARPEAVHIEAAIRKALKTDRQRCKNPYGDGKSTQRISRFISTTLARTDTQKLLVKKFNEL